ncbi:MAG: lipoyl(octanoyl) transferase LipB [Burkholderiales bacterium]
MKNAAIKNDTTSSPSLSPRIKRLGLADYLPTWRAMQDFSAQRHADTPDEIWLLQHPPVYTVGLNGNSEHFPRHTAIPIIKTDRGGQITYHGPGQLIVYVLLDMRRLKLSVRPLVRKLEQAVIDLLNDYGVAAQGRADAPGVYVNGAKIAALGLRIRNGCCYHGLALNVDMNLKPFHVINPCGTPGLQVTQTRDLGIAGPVESLGEELTQKLLQGLAAK